MTVEEKAKAYDEALKRAKEIKEKIVYSHLSTESCKAVSGYIDSIIPELTENEDEKFRKYILQCCKECIEANDKGLELSMSTTKKLLAYLEKQKEQAPVERSREDNYIFGFVYALLNQIEWKDNWAMSKEECLRRLNNYIPQKPEWSEEDEGMMIWLCRIIHSKKVQGEISLKDESRLGEWIDKWLNHSPQPKQEWSELDESNLEDLIGYLNDCVHPLDFASEARFKRRMADWLKSIKPRKKEDLPMWRKWHNGACGNGNNVPIAIVKAGSGYSLTSCLGINGQEYIMLSDLDKLPKED